MLTWWRRRNEREQQVIRDADNLMAQFGDGGTSWHRLAAGRCPPSTELT